MLVIARVGRDTYFDDALVRAVYFDLVHHFVYHRWAHVEKHPALLGTVHGHDMYCDVRLVSDDNLLLNGRLSYHGDVRLDCIVDLLIVTWGCRVRPSIDLVRRRCARLPFWIAALHVLGLLPHGLSDSYRLLRFFVDDRH